MRVLVADDDPVGRHMMATAIELLGHEVTQVVDGRQALDSYLETRFEILVLDWMMPHFDGIVVARRIRGLEAGYAVPTEDLLEDERQPAWGQSMILLATAFDDPQLVAAALEAGVDDYMIKPVSMAEIRARIAIAVERFHLRRRTEERERALRRERARAEALSQARARFLADMSHELRTPLNGIVGMSDYMLTETLPPTHQESLEVIRASALSLDVIINDILDLTQVDEGLIPITPRPLDIRVLMKQIVRLYATRASKANLQLQAHVAPDIPEVLIGDQTRIRQILSNLINNAIKYTYEGLVEVEVSRTDAQVEPPEFRFSVRDSGPGIPEAEQEGLFSRFHRGGEHSEPGHGLGLAICRGLVELMAGRIGVQSELGKGSTFWFTLPLEVGEGMVVTESVTIPRPTKPIAALVVEDDRFNQTVARRLLERAGCQVTIAENGRQGLAKLAASRPDVVFMDLQMPVMNGLEAAQRIRQSEAEGTHIPIVGLTASSVSGARRRCIEAGMDGYLQKPVQLSAIVDALVRFLPGHFQ